MDLDQEVISTRRLQLGPCGFLEKLGTLYPKLPVTEPREDKEPYDEDMTGEGKNSRDATGRGKDPGGPAPAPPLLEEPNQPGPSNPNSKKRRSWHERK